MVMFVTRATHQAVTRCVPKHRKFLNKVALRVQSSNSGAVGLVQKVPKFRVFSVNSSGVRSAYEVSKTVLYHELGLTVRDLRFQHTNMLTVRNKKIIVRFEKLKAVVCNDAVLLIDPPFSKFNSSEAGDIVDFWKNLPRQLTGPQLYTSNLPLEYRALEAIFMHIISSFKQTLAAMEPSINRLLKTLTDPTTLVVDRSLVHVLLQNSARLNTFATSVREFCDLLDEILEYDEDVRALCISIDVGEGGRTLYDAFIFSPYESTTTGEARSAAEGVGQHSIKASTPRRIDHKYKLNLQDEMETLLDSFLRDAEDISNKVAELKEAIENSNTAILINLDSHRNLLLRLELQLTMGMFSCTVFGMLGMAFGMNLESSWEENPLAFWAVSALMFGGAGIVWRSLLMTLRKNTMGSASPQSNKGQGGQDFPTTSHTTGSHSGTKRIQAVRSDEQPSSPEASNLYAKSTSQTPHPYWWANPTDASAVAAESLPSDCGNGYSSEHEYSSRRPTSNADRHPAVSGGSLRMRPLSIIPDTGANLLGGKGKHRHYTTRAWRPLPVTSWGRLKVAITHP